MINVCIFRESKYLLAPRFQNYVKKFTFFPSSHLFISISNFPRLDDRFSNPLSSKNSLHPSSFSFSNHNWLIIQPETCPPLFTPSFVRPSEDACLASKREISPSSRGEGRGGIDYERLALGNSGEITMCQLSRGPFYSPIITSVLAAGLQRTTRLLSFSAPPPFAGGWMDRGAWNDRAPDRPIKVECCSDICPFPIFFFFPIPSLLS